MKLEKQYKPALLEATADKMQDILERKAQDVKAAGLVDYVGFTVELLNDRIERLKIAKADITALIKASEGQQLIIKEQTAIFLEGNGISTLAGDVVSSVKVYTPATGYKFLMADKQKLIDSGYAKVVLDEKAVQADLKEGLTVDGAEMETTHKQPTITIYKRKV